MVRGFGALTLLTAVVVAGCGGSDRPPRQLGLMPSATTSAIAEWLPKRVTAGFAVDDDPRERHLFDLRRLTEGWSVLQTEWSPDGTSLFVLASRPGDTVPGVFRVPADRGEPQRVSREGEAVRTFAVVDVDGAPFVLYAPESERGLVQIPLSAAAAPRVVDVGALFVEGIAAAPASGAVLVARDSGIHKVFALPREGEPKPLLADDVAPLCPAPSPDGAYFAFGRRGRANTANGLAFASVEGRGAGDLVTSPGTSIKAIRFHPGGKLLVFSSDRDRAGFDLYAVALPDTLAAPPPAGTPVRRLTFSQADAPSFSRDGRSLAFTSSRSGPTSDLYVARFLEDP